VAADKLHERFLEIAGGFSPDLQAAMDRVGVPEPRDRGDQPVARFLARAVVGQQLSTTAAGTIWSRVESMAAAEGIAVPGGFTEDRFEALRTCGVSRGKARALLAIRAAEREGWLDGAALAALDHAERSHRLRTIRGVGQWTCDMVSIFHCGDPDVWPETDVAVQRTFVNLIGRRRKPAKAAARFAPQRSWLARYMWRIADADPEARPVDRGASS
jgi:DNA-3-methyladenine glycosylase II